MASAALFGVAGEVTEYIVDVVFDENYGFRLFYGSVPLVLWQCSACFTGSKSDRVNRAAVETDALVALHRCAAIACVGFFLVCTIVVTCASFRLIGVRVVQDLVADINDEE